MGATDQIPGPVDLQNHYKGSGHLDDVLVGTDEVTGQRFVSQYELGFTAAKDAQPASSTGLGIQAS